MRSIVRSTGRGRLLDIDNHVRSPCSCTVEFYRIAECDRSPFVLPLVSLYRFLRVTRSSEGETPYRDARFEHGQLKDCSRRSSHHHRSLSSGRVTKIIRNTGQICIHVDSNAVKISINAARMENEQFGNSKVTRPNLLRG